MACARARCSLSIKGILRAEALGRGTSNSAQGFVAMSFDTSLNDAWLNGFEPGIRGAGFRPLRIDNKEYLGGITDEMIAEKSDAPASSSPTTLANVTASILRPGSPLASG